eukprot:SAG31_NODE_17789_length_657_cov_6.456989_1_plen_53_part_00
MYLSIVLNPVNFCARLFSTGIDYGCTAVPAVHVPVLVRGCLGIQFLLSINLA